MPRLPVVVSPLPADLRRFLDRTQEIVGSAATTAEAVDLQLVRITSGGQLVAIPGQAGPEAAPADPPTVPVGLAANGAMTAVQLTWGAATYTGHAYAEIWRADSDDRDLAQRIGMSPGTIFSDAVGPGRSVFYWLRFVNTDNTAGPFNAVAGVPAQTAPDLTYLMGQLTDAADPLNPALPYQETLFAPGGIGLKTAWIHNAAITRAKIGLLAADAVHFASGAITRAKIANAAVTSAKIAAASIARAQIADLAIGSAQIATAAVTSAKVGTAVVDTAHIKDAAVDTLRIGAYAVTDSIAVTAFGNAYLWVPVDADTLGVPLVLEVSVAFDPAFNLVSGDELIVTRKWWVGAVEYEVQIAAALVGMRNTASPRKRAGLYLILVDTPPVVGDCVYQVWNNVGIERCDMVATRLKR